MNKEAFRHRALNRLLYPFWQIPGLMLMASEDILVGGQAVIEGVMMRSPRSYSVAVRRPDQSIATKKDFVSAPADWSRIWSLPVFRGMATLGQALVLGIRALKFSTDLALESIAGEESSPAREKMNKDGKDAGVWFIGFNLVLALIFFIVLFKLMPLYLANLLKNLLPAVGNPMAFSLVDGTIRMAIFLGYITAISFLKDIRRVFQYHGAEHKVVFNFESGDELRVENARRFKTLHPRCGTSFLLVVMLVSILIYALIPFQSFGLKLVSRILLLPLVAGVSYEIIRFAAKRPRALLRYFTLPGLWLQRITTREPSDDQLEIALYALKEALALEKSGDRVLVA